MASKPPSHNKLRLRISASNKRNLDTDSDTATAKSKRPSLLDAKQSSNYDSEDDYDSEQSDDELGSEELTDEEVGSSIEEPTMYVQGEGSGQANKCENTRLSECDDFDENGIGEAIEEDVFFVIGEGSGQECDVGNNDVKTTETTTPTSESKPSGPSKPMFFFGQAGCLKLSPMKTSASTPSPPSNDDKNDSDNIVPEKTDETATNNDETSTNQPESNASDVNSLSTENNSTNCDETDKATTSNLNQELPLSEPIVEVKSETNNLESNNLTVKNDNDHEKATNESINNDQAPSEKNENVENISESEIINDSIVEKPLDEKTTESIRSTTPINNESEKSNSAVALTSEVVQENVSLVESEQIEKDNKREQIDDSLDHATKDSEVSEKVEIQPSTSVELIAAQEEISVDAIEAQPATSVEPIADQPPTSVELNEDQPSTSVEAVKISETELESEDQSNLSEDKDEDIGINVPSEKQIPILNDDDARENEIETTKETEEILEENKEVESQPESIAHPEQTTNEIADPVIEEKSVEIESEVSESIQKLEEPAIEKTESISEQIDSPAEIPIPQESSVIDTNTETVEPTPNEETSNEQLAQSEIVPIEKQQTDPEPEQQQETQPVPEEPQHSEADSIIASEEKEEEEIAKISPEPSKSVDDDETTGAIEIPKDDEVVPSPERESVDLAAIEACIIPNKKSEDFEPTEESPQECTEKSDSVINSIEANVEPTTSIEKVPQEDDKKEQTSIEVPSIDTSGSITEKRKSIDQIEEPIECKKVYICGDKDLDELKPATSLQKETIAESIEIPQIILPVSEMNVSTENLNAGMESIESNTNQNDSSKGFDLTAMIVKNKEKAARKSTESIEIWHEDAKESTSNENKAIREDHPIEEKPAVEEIIKPDIIKPEETVVAPPAENKIEMSVAKSTRESPRVAQLRNRKRRMSGEKVRHSSESEIDNFDSPVSQDQSSDEEVGGKRIKMRGKAVQKSVRKSVEQKRNLKDADWSSDDNEKPNAKRTTSDVLKQVESPLPATTEQIEQVDVKPVKEELSLPEKAPKIETPPKEEPKIHSEEEEAASQRRPGRPGRKAKKPAPPPRSTRSKVIEEPEPVKEEPVKEELVKEEPVKEEPVKEEKPETVSPAKPEGRRKKRSLMGLDIKDVETIQAAAENDAPVRQSRRIAQIKIREEAERRKAEEVALHKMKEASEKKKKGGSYVETPKSESEEENSESEAKLEKKKRKKKFNKDRPWQTDSDATTEHEEHEDDIYEDVERLPPLRSDHEFSPESDIEDESQIVPTKRARTARKDKAEKKAEEESEEEDVHACQKCSKSDHPEWILLCDKCDKGLFLSIVLNCLSKNV